MLTEPLRMAMIDYGLRILALSAVISIFTAVLLFVAVRKLMVQPIQRVVRSMTDYAASPQDAARIITPQGRVKGVARCRGGAALPADGTDRRAEAARASGAVGGGRGQDQPRPAQHAVGRHAGRRQAGKLRGSHRATHRAETGQFAQPGDQPDRGDARLSAGPRNPAPKLDRVPVARAGARRDRERSACRRGGPRSPTAATCLPISACVRIPSNCTVSCRTLCAMPGRPSRHRMARDDPHSPPRTADGWVNRKSLRHLTRLCRKRRSTNLFKPFHAVRAKGGTGLALRFAPNWERTWRAVGALLPRAPKEPPSAATCSVALRLPCSHSVFPLAKPRTAGTL